MTTLTAARRDAVVPHPSRRRLLLTCAVAVVAVALVAVSAFALAGLWNDGRRAVPGGALAFDGGHLTVGAVTPEVMSHPKGMPQSMMPDPLPEGWQRFSVAVTLYADESGAVSYASDRIRVLAPGARPAAPLRSTLDSGVIPAGARVSGTLLYQVPQEASVVTLTLEGADAGLRLAVPESPGHHDSGEEGPPGGAPTSPQGGVVAPEGRHAH